MSQRCVYLVVIATCVSPSAFGDGPGDNHPESVRPVPPPGIRVPDASRREIEAALAQLDTLVANLTLRSDDFTHELLPDVEIYARAVHQALDHDEFLHEREIGIAVDLIREGTSRAQQLLQGEAPWMRSAGLVVRGYRSRLDQTVQPYGLVLPQSAVSGGSAGLRLDIWFHGRGENLTELNFIQGRRTQRGTFAPPETIVLHPYGRYSNAFKFAGEIDVLEALESVRRRYRVDDDRIAVRGFSMGGAACWQFAVHYADRWFAANPGGGFSETPEFLTSFQKETLHPTWFERRLWHLYDSNDWALNLAHCPTVAYSGELDIQRQAADVMERALGELGIDLVHVIGPGTRHRYHPESARIVDARLASLAERGRERLPRHVRFVTWTLRYNRMHWVTVEGLGEHWQKATVDARITSDSEVRVDTTNATRLALSMPPGWCPLDVTQRVSLTIDGKRLDAPGPRSDRSWTVRLARAEAGWKVATDDPPGLRKKHGLQGPIDDAFMDSFIFVRPTEQSPHVQVTEWASAEMARAVREWRRHFRGDAQVRDDREVSEEDLRDANLVLWGDPSSNLVLKRIVERLPIRWSAGGIVAGDRTYDATDHALILVYPNPLNPERYVVLNSGFTYREYAYLNNARQVPKLPDWAVIDLKTPPGTLWPGRVVAADFFDENWKLKPSH